MQQVKTSTKTHRIRRTAARAALPRCCGVGAKAVRGTTAQVAPRFRALGDPTRLQILGLLAKAQAPLCVCHLENHLDVLQPTVSHHMKILRDSGLVESERRGTWIYYSLAREALAEVAAVVREWSTRA